MLWGGFFPPHINSDITSLIVTSGTKWGKQAPGQVSEKDYHTFASLGHRQSSFCIDDSLWLSCNNFIRVIFEMNNFWCEAAILSENRYIFRFTPPSMDLLIKVWNRIVEKQTLKRLQNVAAEPCQTAVPDDCSMWNSSPKLRKVLIYCCICHLNTYFQNALAYLEKDWYYTLYQRPLQLIMTVGRRV